MPQLMPLYWLCSVLLVMFILLMLVDLYYFKEKEFILVEFEEVCNYNIMYMW